MVIKGNPYKRQKSNPTPSQNSVTSGPSSRNINIKIDEEDEEEFSTDNEDNGSEQEDMNSLDRVIMEELSLTSEIAHIPT